DLRNGVALRDQVKGTTPELRRLRCRHNGLLPGESSPRSGVRNSGSGSRHVDTALKYQADILVTRDGYRKQREAFRAVFPMDLLTPEEALAVVSERIADTREAQQLGQTHWLPRWAPGA
ncbi:MAG: hypothetical protein Q8M17_02465, partial [Actinomycetota bacterium]|nr:hypothetical protein [Actinomycetota bacterium]